MRALLTCSQSEGGSIKCEYQVRWKGFGPSGDTWEPGEHLEANCTEMVRGYYEDRDKEKKKEKRLAGLRKLKKKVPGYQARELSPRPPAITYSLRSRVRPPKRRAHPRRDRGR